MPPSFDITLADVAIRGGWQRSLQTKRSREVLLERAAASLTGVADLVADLLTGEGLG